jgi:drug/metabolite transporter (DMT)-like permease
MNIRFKEYVWDTVDRKKAKGLVGRVILGFINLSLQAQAVAKVTLVLSSTSSNMVPLVTALLACCFLKERLGLPESICLMISFSGVMMMVFGTDKTSSDTNIDAIAIIALVFNPIVSSLITILLRTMKGINHHTAAFYYVLFQCAVYTVAIVASMNFDFVGYFKWYDWILISFGALFTFFYQVFRQVSV